MLNDVSFDQISTYFDSYYGYLTAAFDTDFNVLVMKSRIARFVEKYIENNGVEPSLRAISLNFSFKGLLEFTGNEISELMPKNPKKQTFDNSKNTDQLTILKKATEKKDDLVNQYKTTVFNRGDIKKLSDLEQIEIKKEFPSISLFLKALKGSNDE